MYTYPHTIDNGAGESLTFLRRVNHPDGDYLEVENVVAPGSGPPMHTHHYQEESLTVVKGRIGYQVQGEEKKYAGEGETVHFAAGVPHKFWNAGEENLHCAGYIKPPDNVEYFLTEIYASTKENGGKEPNRLDGAFLMGRYKSEFSLNEIPTFVQKMIFPVMRVVGSINGRYKKYANAPEPVRR